MNVEALQSAIQYAPKVKNTNPDVAGFWTRERFYVCADCGARLMGRGFGSELKEVVYTDNTRGTCIACEPLRNADGDLVDENGVRE